MSCIYDFYSPQPWTEFRVEKRYFEENKAVWRALEDAHAAGKVKVIGVSNFLQDDLENLLSDCRVKPMVNQILLHISNSNLALVDYCKAQGIQLGTVALPKTADPAHMASNADVDFVISDADMETLKHMEHIADYGDFNIFPVFSGKPLA